MDRSESTDHKNQSGPFPNRLLRALVYPRPGNRWIWGGATLAFLAGSGLFTWLSQDIHWGSHLMYIPVLLAAALFRFPGALVASLAAGLLLGPFLIWTQPDRVGHAAVEWLFQVVSYLAIGGSASVLFNYLKTREAQVRRLFEIVGDGFMVFDAEGRIVESNEPMAQLLGFSNVSELIGRRSEDFMDEANQAVRHREWAKRPKGIDEPYPIQWRREDGMVVDTLVFPHGLFDHGRFQGSLGLVVNLSTKPGERLERDVLSSRLERLLAVSPTILYNCQVEAAEGRVTRKKTRYISPNVSRILGYSTDTILGRSECWFENLHPDDVPRILSIPQDWFKEDRLAVEYRLRHQDGGYRVIHDELTLRRDAQGAPMEIVGTLYDVTGEKELEELERIYRNLFITMAQGVVYQAADGRIIDANPAALEIMGLTFDQIRSRTSLDPRWLAIHEDGSEFDGEEHPAMIALKTGEPVSGVVMGVFNAREEDWRWIRIHAVPRTLSNQSQPYQVFTTFEDITEVKRQQDELRRLNHALTALSGANRLVLRAQEEQTLLSEVCRFMVDTVGFELVWVGYARDDETKTVEPMAAGGLGVLDESPASIRITWADDDFGQGPPGTAIRTGRPALCHDMLLASKDIPWKQAVAVKSITSAVSLPLIHQGRAFGALNIYSKVPYYFDETQLGLLIDLAGNLAFGVQSLRTWEQLSDRKRELIESEAKYRSVVDSATVGIAIIQGGVFRFVNPKVEELYGYSLGELSIRPFWDFVHPQDREMVQSRYLARMKGVELSPDYTCRIINNEGDTRWVAVKDRRLTWEGQKTVLGFLLDITQQKKLEEQYRHSQKMEAVGVLAGGIAHDFNNLLQIIGGYTEIMMMQATSSDQEKDDIGEVLRAVERAVELTQGLLAFSRKVESVMRPMNLNEQVQHVLKLLSRTLPKSIEIAMNLEEGLTRVSGDPAQIEQVIMNLAVNARDAMPKGGSLTIETKSVQVEYPHPILDYGARRGRYVQVMIRDTGIGMDAYTMARMFDPFFTTKGVGKGTGLGLSMVYGLVKNHGGYIDCRSQPDQGTQFILYFPEDGAGLELVDGGELDLETLKGAARILMVDDEPQIHMVVKRYLESTGYTLRSAISGEEAADIFIRDWRTIDLVLLDLIMPGMGGERLLKKIRENNPEIPVIIVSGAREEDMAEYSRSIGAQAFLKKPFTRKEMLAILHQVLSGGNYLAPATR